MTHSVEHYQNKKRFFDSFGYLTNELSSRDIEYRVIGSIATAAYLQHTDDSSLSMDFDRKGAIASYQSVPDIDIIVPRTELDQARELREDLINGRLPVKLGLAVPAGEIDFRPDDEMSILTHGDVHVPVDNSLLIANELDYEGVKFDTFSLDTLFQTYQTFGGVLREKDLPKVRGLAKMRKNSAREMQSFRDFRVMRRKNSSGEWRMAKAYEAFNSHTPTTVQNCLGIAAIKAADVLGKR